MLCDSYKPKTASSEVFNRTCLHRVLYEEALKVCFIYDPWDNEKTLNLYKKMTPKRSGCWKDLESVTNQDEADWCVVVDDTSRPMNPDRTLYIGAHPQMSGYEGYRDLSRHLHKLDLAETMGFGEWWLDHDYDYLSSLEPMEKTKDCCFIVSNSVGGYGRERRKELAKELNGRIDVYGRISGVGAGTLGSTENDGGNHTWGKEDVLSKYRYSVEVDVGPTQNYFSERVFDSLLMWCMPLIWGSTNVEQYLPKDSFQYIDIYGSGKDILEISKSDIRERNLGAIAEARQLLLNKYQIFARSYEYIKAHS